MRFLQAAVVVFLASCGPAWADHGGKDIVSVGRSAEVGPGGSSESVVVVGSSAVIRGEVMEDLVVIGGTADVDGKVRGDMVALGSARLGPRSEVRGNAVVIGRLEQDPLAKIGGQRVLIGAAEWAPRLERARASASATLLRLRPVAPGIWWTWGLALSFLLLYALAAAGAPAAVDACSETLVARPMSSLLAGILGLSGLAPFAFLLAISIAGIAIIPLLVLTAFTAMVAGKAGLLRALGGRGLRLLSLPSWDRPLAAVVLAGLAFIALYSVPVLGAALWFLSLLLGFGAALLASVAALRRERGMAEASPAPAEDAEGDQRPALQADMPRAGFWIRLAATVIDAFLFLVIAGATHLIALGLGGWAVYQVALWTWKGTTLGGMIVGIKGVRLDGRPMDLPVAVVRHLAGYLSALPMFLGFVWAGWDADKQAWHDKIAGTLVIRVPRWAPPVEQGARR